MILGIGTPLEILIAIAMYMIAFVVCTERFKEGTDVKGKKALLLSWLFGILAFIGISLLKLYQVNFQTVVLFVFVTGITNRLYKWETLKTFIRKILKIEV